MTGMSPEDLPDGSPNKAGTEPESRERIRHNNLLVPGTTDQIFIRKQKLHL